MNIKAVKTLAVGTFLSIATAFASTGTTVVHAKTNANEHTVVTSSAVSPIISSATSPSTSSAVAVTRTRAWDSIRNTLGGTPESVQRIEYAGSLFYLGKDVTQADFLAVLAVGPEAVRLKSSVDVGMLYIHPVYILWNSDKTALLVHPIVFAFDDVLEAVSIPTAPPASLLETADVSKTTQSPPNKAQSASKTQQDTMALTTAADEIAYMLTDEYADAVRNEFYRILNEHRTANGRQTLEINVELQAYADLRADEQSVRFGHTRPNGGVAGSGWYDSKNTLNSRYAENALSVGVLNPDPTITAEKIFKKWKDSSGHNRHMLYNFDARITMAFGIAPRLNEKGKVTSGAIFATGY